ncbi:hypothetical protein LEP1GSC116_3906 [Leptospira interrogans serovar Icterohaemorrhagiae str. Verdun HP]|uniref:Uncharacterized protein n=4 Tax=Leptospira interrogans TaxID=173 RepID=M6RPT7_LEPIR|nr:hypothetical protein G436_1482 [Leptospira interrogans serovar Hardjo str. Norma]EMG22523.1 hypothetical protein LEP1GSC150_2420 [Leptospira interrogans serovar Copenhageni str. LT2050]EMO06534.1 hypothetical protein LEP1GSC116_3906 [Leptospira interrogans serovar Icterohaemorrhagiae str. Verdun HP]EMY23311.1 hypothetical protein LEP1GSC115_4260 [Leptospira interrogans serovar Australis str. 200703203]
MASAFLLPTSRFTVDKLIKELIELSIRNILYFQEKISLYVVVGTPT